MFHHCHWSSSNHWLLSFSISTYSSYQCCKRLHTYLLPTVQYSQFITLISIVVYLNLYNPLLVIFCFLCHTWIKGYLLTYLLTFCTSCMEFSAIAHHICTITACLMHLFQHCFPWLLFMSKKWQLLLDVLIIFLALELLLYGMVWTEPSTRRVSSSRVGLVVGKKPDPRTTHPVAYLALKVAGGWWARLA